MRGAHRARPSLGQKRGPARNKNYERLHHRKEAPLHRLVSLAARVLGSPTFRRVVHSLGVCLIAAAQLIAIWC